MRGAFLFVWLLTCLGGAGCGGASNEIHLADYNRSCTLATDCVAIRVGNVCGCGAMYGAINVADLARDEGDYSAANSHCSQDTVLNCPSPSAGQLDTTCSPDHVCQMLNPSN
jgi:hypothetical protein